MSDIKLTCDETPLAWPASVSLEELKSCKTCGIRVHSPQPGSLQILTRRQGDGVGDGVNIDESISVGADYRGQRYSLDEAIFHTPGLHMFPGRKELYPAEYHIHMRTMTAPIRYITIVIPVSHLAPSTLDAAPLGAEVAKAYFAAMRAKPDPSVVRPTLDTLLTSASGKGIQMIQYQGPDLRGRTDDKESQAPDDICNSSAERQFLLVLNVAPIRATDLERIPREGSLSTDPRDLPAPGIQPKKTVPRDQLLRSAVLADPGILTGKKPLSGPDKGPVESGEMECKPVKVVNGRDVIDVSGKAVDVKQLLGLGDSNMLGGGQQQGQVTPTSLIESYGRHALMFVGTLLGLLLSDYIIGKVWALFFLPSARLDQWEPVKFFLFLNIALVAGGLTDGILGLVDDIVDYVVGGNLADDLTSLLGSLFNIVKGQLGI
jgi:hypothetical protein